MAGRRTIAINTIVAVAAVAAAGAGVLALRDDKASAASTTTIVDVKRGNVLTSVTASGNVTSQSQIDVNFDSAVTGQLVTQVLVKPGDKVTKGQPLAKVDDRTVQSALTLAQIQLTTALANLEKTKTGLTTDERAQDAAQADQAREQLTTAQQNLDNARANAAQNQIGYAESVRQAQLALDNATAQTTQDLAVAQAAYDAAKANLDAANAASPQNPATIATAQAALTNAQTALTNAQLKAKQSLDSANNALVNAKNNQAANSLKDQQAVTNAERSLASQQASYNSTIAGIAVKEAPATAATLGQAESSVISAQNSLATAQKNADSATLVAPADGTVATVNGKLNALASQGQGTAVGAGFVVLTDTTSLQVKAGFSEADATKVKVGQAATLTLDALSGTAVTGKVDRVDFAATTTNNVVTYAVYVSIDKNAAAANVRPGMTATVSVVIDKADGALYLPSYAVTSRGTSANLTVIPSGGKVQENRQVTIGLRGDNGIVISSGLNEGDKVVVTRTTSSSASRTGATGTGVAGVGGVTGAGGAIGGAGGGFGGGRGGGALMLPAAPPAAPTLAPVEGSDGRPIIDIRHASKVYGEGDVAVHTLRDVSLRIDRGDYVAIVGQSGSGKSTLMNIIGCLDGPTSGTYVLDGTDVDDHDDYALAAARNRTIGFVFQSFNLIRATAVANVELPLVYAGLKPAERRRRALAALEAVGLAERVTHRPNELSGGQQQRVAIARALVTNPALILADEPTGALDTASTADVLGLFERVNARGRTIVVITHEHEVAARAKRVVTLRDGSVIGDVRNRPIDSGAASSLGGGER